jgi:hypothetical protein
MKPRMLPAVLSKCVGDGVNPHENGWQSCVEQRATERGCLFGQPLFVAWWQIRLYLVPARTEPR